MKIKIDNVKVFHCSAYNSEENVFFFFWDKNWVAEVVLGSPYLTAPSLD